MPISIYKADYSETLATLGEADWDLPKQICELENWLVANEKELTVGDYVADIGFSVRKDASGGGAALSPQSMKIMGSLGMSLFLSEY